MEFGIRVTHRRSGRIKTELFTVSESHVVDTPGNENDEADGGGDENCTGEAHDGADAEAFTTPGQTPLL